MKIKYISLFISFFFFSAQILKAQSVKNEEKEIVMTKTQLDSLLKKIVEFKKARIESRKKELAINRQYLNLHLDSGKVIQKQSNNDSIYVLITKMKDKLDSLNKELNARKSDTVYLTKTINSVAEQGLNALNLPSDSTTVLRANTLSRTNPLSHSSTAPTRTTTAPITSTLSTSPNYPNLKQADPLKKNEVTTKQTAPTSPLQVENKKSLVVAPIPIPIAGKSIENKREIVVHDSMARVKKNPLDTIDKQLSLKLKLLEIKVDSLEQYKSVVKIDTIRLKNERIIAKALPLTIYFDNNSVSIKGKDSMALAKLIEESKLSTKTVILRGFSSSIGNANYNNVLSFRRAEAVKETLLLNGLKARNIMTLYHGVDDSVSEAKARRVELSILYF